MKCPNCNVNILPSRNNYKTIIQLNEYINQIKNGENSIMFGKEFVVLSTDEYKKLVSKEDEDE